MIRDYSRDDVMAVLERVVLPGGPAPPGTPDEKLQFLANLLTIQTDSARGTAGLDWCLDMLHHLRRLFILAPPDAPGLSFIGAELIEKVSETDLCVTGVDLNPSDALSAACGEISELRAIFCARKTPPAVLSSTRTDSCNGLAARLHNASRDVLTIEGLCVGASGSASIPAALCFGREAVPGGGEPLVPRSEGCGAGKSRSEAARHGLFELIERDAAALWWYGGRQARHLRFDASGQAKFDRFRNRARRGKTGRCEVLLDITSDLSVPAVAAVSFGPEGRDYACGTAARHSYGAAARAAYREMCQMELSHHIRRAKREQAGEGALSVREREEAAQVAAIDGRRQPLFWPEAKTNPLHYDNHSPRQESLEGLQERLGQVGIELYEVDLSRHEEQVAVVKVISPQLQPATPDVETERLAGVRMATGGTEAFTKGLRLI
ncbi:MAG: YcaO-like family protein [Pseudomonadota bacterium]